jgi:hypothetical protein
VKTLALEMVRGDTLTIDVHCEKPDPATGVLLPINLTGAKVWFTAKRFVTDDDLHAKVQVSTTGGGVVVVNAPGGVARVTVPAGSTAPPVLPDDPIDLAYDVQVLEASGALTTVQRGTLTVNPDITLALS